MQNKEFYPEDDIREVVKSSVRKHPNNNFENQVMLKIVAEKVHRRAVLKQLKTSMCYFFGAIFMGLSLIVVTLLLEVSELVNMTSISVLASFVFGVIGVLNLGNYNRIISQYK